jgi:two-component system, OmpR family, phosphate regulon sensor histidine kinase PhoR
MNPGRKTIKSKLFLYFFSLFAIFTISILLFQQNREKQFRIAQLENRLNDYSDLVNRFINVNGIPQKGDYTLMDSLKKLVPPDEIRITVLNTGGKVLYDNSVAEYSQMENHLKRPEVQKAKYADKGYNIRHSATTHEDYFYFAKYYGNLIIRSAVVYNNEIRNYLRIEHVFIGYLILLFAGFGFILWLIARRLGDSVARLKEFTVKMSRDEEISSDYQFPDDELGSISREFSKAYDQTRKVRAELLLEKEKLISHLFVLKEGVGFFSAGKKVILTNSHFIFYINTISEESSVLAENIFQLEAFREINEFIDKTLSAGSGLLTGDLPRQEFSVHRNAYHFLIRCMFFQDRSFEILIIDNTQLVKRSVMKQQLTANIAHELKTPISSIKGYLETVMNNPGIEPVKLRYFVEKAHSQAERLTQLVNDIALLNKIEESSDLYAREKVNVRNLILDVAESLDDALKSKSVNLEIQVGGQVIVHANYSLLFSVFRNLLENSLNYGGKGISVTVSGYHEDQHFHYFSYSDNGQGVEDEHLPRLFERFYRVDDGRSRKMGGTGLGLAIVKNAILSFKGDISVRKRSGGGLEFLFSLPK